MVPAARVRFDRQHASGPVSARPHDPATGFGEERSFEAEVRQALPEQPQRRLEILYRRRIAMAHRPASPDIHIPAAAHDIALNFRKVVGHTRGELERCQVCVLVMQVQALQAHACERQSSCSGRYFSRGKSEF